MAESMSLNITGDLIQGSNVFCVWGFPGVYVYPGEQGHTWRSQWAVNIFLRRTFCLIIWLIPRLLLVTHGFRIMWTLITEPILPLLLTRGWWGQRSWGQRWNDGVPLILIWHGQKFTSAVSLQQGSGDCCKSNEGAKSPSGRHRFQLGHRVAGDRVQVRNQSASLVLPAHACKNTSGCSTEELECSLLGFSLHASWQSFRWTNHSSEGEVPHAL